MEHRQPFYGGAGSRELNRRTDKETSERKVAKRQLEKFGVASSQLRADKG